MKRPYRDTIAKLYLLFEAMSYDVKIAICTMGKKENLYAKEFVEYYLKLGVKHIFIYDDNDPNTEKISDVINGKYRNHITIYENIKKTVNNQSIAFTQCYKNNKNSFDWFLMIDMDEYLVINNEKLKKYLSKEAFKKCDFIKIHWLLATDNNLLHYENKSLFERFKPPFIKNHLIKTIVKGNINNLQYDIHNPIYSPKRNISCNNVGEILNEKAFSQNAVGKINVDNAYILHFKFKSTEEFINKYKRGYSNWFTPEFLRMRINEYFKNNEITLKKIIYMEKELNINLSSFKKIIKKG